MIFKRDSRQKMVVITMSIMDRVFERTPLGSFKGLSMAMSTVENMITKIMKGSNKLCNTMDLTLWRMQFFGPNKNNEYP
jgi:hypothetical protein